ncbi:MAG: SRPBCC domain-containing protein [Pseudobdellovibrionaceae bacterium]|nr:SRPBCC domain-containing protein [Pseudobdellovibrionaceae bacterium]
MQTGQEKSSESSLHRDHNPQSKPVEIKRNFRVPVEHLFSSFKTSEAIKAWWWPKDLYADRVNFEFREGGRYFINMKGENSGGKGMTGEFEEIIENSRIVMTDRFADENGQELTPQEAKMPGWPETVYITFEFSATGANSSQLSLAQEGIPSEMHDDCVQGWSQMFDKLEKHLNSARS